ncbi:hypothetical protein KP509_26G013500 [Ceratopteris richardii]|uniref:Pentatricopeptide repeat-containing protein n=1 Tax=Ceratopteris richardii TaxID=49495 RepID=A0A8T2RKV1_CERRI|nr:hypothetical protein KP509_26G013500 [Ceratopteris richardii]
MASCSGAFIPCLIEQKISKYIKSGNLQQALALYKTIKSSASDHENTLVCLLKGCIKLNDVDKASEVHSAIAIKGLDRNPVIGRSLVDFYAKHGKLKRAQEVFDKLETQDVAVWTPLISGYAKHGHAKEALLLYGRMCETGVLATSAALSCCLRACSSIQEIRKGQEIHAEVERRGLLEQDRTIANGLVDLYANCGLLAKAREVFYQHQNRDVVSWTTIMSAYAKNGQSDEALNQFEYMQQAGVSPDLVAFVCAVKACSNIKAGLEGLVLHVEIARHEAVEKNLILGNALVDMYVNCSLLSKAQDVFDKLPVKDRISYTALIGGYAVHGFGNEALELLELMQLNGVTPNVVTYICGLKACRSIGALDRGEQIHEELLNHGLLGKDLNLSNTLIDMYASCGSFAKAQEVFNELKFHNVVSWTALIAGYVNYGHGEEAICFFELMQQNNIVPDAVSYSCALRACGTIGAAEKGLKLHQEVQKRRLLASNLVLGNALVDMYAKCGLLLKAKEVFCKLPMRDTVSWNALLAGYVNNEHSEEALKVLHEMQCKNVPFDEVTIICGLKACGNLGALEVGSQLHAKVDERRSMKDDILVTNALIDMYAGCGLMYKAQEIFDKVLDADIVSWTSLIAGYGQLGKSKEAFEIYDRMREIGVLPNTVTFQSVLNACSHVGLFNEASTYLQYMNYYELTESLGHVTCIIDLLARAGQLQVAVSIIECMPFHPNLVIWHIILSACNKCSHVKLGRHVFEHALALNEYEPSTYISAGNLYGHALLMKQRNDLDSVGDAGPGFASL